MLNRTFSVVLLIVLSLGFPISVFAQEDLTISVVTLETCGDTAFEITIQGGEAPYNLTVEFGDGDRIEISDVFTIPYTTHHMYPSQGEYPYSVKAYGSVDHEGETEGVVIVAGPTVVLESNPSPPLLPLGSEGTRIDFTAIVSGGTGPYTFEWDLDDDGGPDEATDPVSNTASYTYTHADRIEANIKVTDVCGFSEVDTLTVVIVDPLSEQGPDDVILEEEGDPDSEDDTNLEKGCHPVAQRISDAINILTPGQKESDYSCEDIFNFFKGDEGGLHHSFGLLWRAYQMTQIIDELTWEDILDWHLEGSGWGVLQQLNRFAESLDEVGLAELYEQVMSGESSVGDIRNALRAAMRFEADFTDALERLENGTSPGELKQLYRTLMEMELEPALLDEYLDMGISLSEITHASRLADQTGGEWQVLLGAYNQGYEWGEIRKAFRLADETTDFETILTIGADAYRDQQRELQHAEQALEKDTRIAARMAEQYGMTEEEILVLLQSVCDGNWECVRDHLREQAQVDRNSEKNQRTALQIAEKYGVLEAEVWNVFDGDCQYDWGCVRGYFRDQTQKEHSKSTR